MVTRGRGKENELQNISYLTLDDLTGESLEHHGTLYDPIPYSGNMALENGKYYMQNDVIYLCIRDTGNPVYHALSALVGLYVEITDSKL